MSTPVVQNKSTNYDLQHLLVCDDEFYNYQNEWEHDIYI
jgi:hypothetical protein